MTTPLNELKREIASSLKDADKRMNLDHVIFPQDMKVIYSYISEIHMFLYKITDTLIALKKEENCKKEGDLEEL